MNDSDDIRADIRPYRRALRRLPEWQCWLQLAPAPLGELELTGGPTISSDLPATEQEAIERLEPFLFPDGWSCVQCENRTWRGREDRPRVRICRRCRCSRSITSGTLLRGQRDLRRFFHGTAWLLERVRSTAAFAREYGCNRKTAFATFRRLRQALVRPVERLDEPIVAAPIGRLTQVDQPAPAPPVRCLLGETVPAHRACAVAWLGGSKVVCFPTNQSSREHAAAFLPADCNPDPLAVEHHIPLEHGQLGLRLASYLRLAIRRAHRYVSTRWVGRYLGLQAWMIELRNQGVSRWQQRDRLLMQVVARPPCTIPNLVRPPPLGAAA